MRGRHIRARHVLVGLVGSLLLVVTGCGDDGGASSATESAAVQTDAAPTTAAVATEPAAPTDVAEEPDPTATPVPPPTEVPAPPPIDETNLQERLIDAKAGDVIEIPAGTFSFDRSLSLTVDGVTIRGAGMDQTVLSFADQVTGAEGLLVTASDFTVEDLAIEDTVGDALKINEGTNIIIRRVRTEWTGGWSTDNGAYGIYPVQTTNVLIEDSVAVGASDAGIYVGQSDNVVVRGNRAEYNVAGIEIENSVKADVYDNVATNNTGGILVFNMPNIAKEGSHTRVYNNEVVANNTENFGHEGTAVAAVPAGSGVLVMANDNVEIFDNRIQDNRSANIIVTSAETVGFGGGDNPDFDGFPEGIHIHGNEMGGGGTEPESILLALSAIMGGAPMPDVVWDGAVDETKLVDGDPAPENRICVDQPDSDVLNADGANGFVSPLIATDDHVCSLDPLDPVELAAAS